MGELTTSRTSCCQRRNPAFDDLLLRIRRDRGHPGSPPGGCMAPEDNKRIL